MLGLQLYGGELSTAVPEMLEEQITVVPGIVDVCVYFSFSFFRFSFSRSLFGVVGDIRADSPGEGIYGLRIGFLCRGEYLL